MAPGLSPLAQAGGGAPRGRAGRQRPRPFLATTLPLGACGLRPRVRLALAAGRPAPAALTIVTWLILPVVICLSQRLSHACLSISNYTVKLRMAH